MNVIFLKWGDANWSWSGTHEGGAGIKVFTLSISLRVRVCQHKIAASVEKSLLQSFFYSILNSHSRYSFIITHALKLIAKTRREMSTTCKTKTKNNETDGLGK